MNTKKNKIAIFGECMAEFSYQKNATYSQSFGGDTFNCAVYLKKANQNAQVEYITILGDDLLSNQMLNFFHQHQINTNYITNLKNNNCGLYLINTINGEKNFIYWRENSAARKLFSNENLPKLNKQIFTYDLIYFSAISLAIMTKQARNNFFEFLQKAKAKNIKIAFDSNYRPSLYQKNDNPKEIYQKALKLSNIFLPSIDDEKILFNESNPENIINKAIKSGCKEIIVKRGEDDIVYYANDKINYFKINKVENMIDSTAAGDSFNGTYLGLRLNGESILSAIEKSQKVSAKVIMHKGAIIPS